MRGKKPEDYPKKYLAKVKSSAEGTGADVAKDLPGNSVSTAAAHFAFVSIYI